MKHSFAPWRRRAGALLLTLSMIGLGLGLAATPADVAAIERQARPPARNVEPVAQIGGSVDHVAVRNGYAYVGQGSRLVVFDVSDPALPRPVFSTPAFNDDVKQIVLSGPYAFVVAGANLELDGGGVHVFALDDPARPVEIGVYAVPGQRVPTLDLLGSSGTLGFVVSAAPNRPRDLVEFSDPANPKLVAEAVMPSGPLAIHGQVAYLYSYRPSFLQVLDISDPARPVEIGRMDEKARIESMTVAGNSLLLMSEEDVLETADLTDPANPRVVAQTDYRRSAFDSLVLAGGRGYLGSRYNALLAVADFADTAHPVTLGTAKTGAGSPQSVAVNGNYAYVAAASGGFRVFSVADPAHPVEVGAYDAPGQPTGTTSVAVQNGMAYVADQSNGLHILRIDDPAHPTPVGVYRDGAEAWRVAVSGSYAYLLTRTLEAGEPTLRVIDVSDPTRPVRVGGIRVGVRPEDIALVGSTAYVATTSGIHVVDISDPRQPREVGSFQPPLDPAIANTSFAGRSARVAVAGSYAFVASITRISGGRGTSPAPSPTDSGLRVVDFSNPAAPTQVAFVPLPWSPDAIAVVGSAVYVVADQMTGGEESGLRVFDVSDALHPVAGATLPTGDANFSGAISVSGRYAFVAAEGLHILDVANPLHPVEVGFDPAPLDSVAADGTYAFVGSGSEGFTVLRFTAAAP